MTPTAAPRFFGFLLTCLLFRTSSSQSGELTAVRLLLTGARLIRPRRAQQRIHPIIHTLSHLCCYNTPLLGGRQGWANQTFFFFLVFFDRESRLPKMLVT